MLHEEGVTPLLPVAGGAFPPGVVAGGRDAQRVAQQPHGPLVPVLFDEAVHHSASWAKSAVAFLKCRAPPAAAGSRCGGGAAPPRRGELAVAGKGLVPLGLQGLLPGAEQDLVDAEG